MPDDVRVYGYPIRNPYTKEMEYFKKNPHVAGMMSQEGESIVLNPFSKNTHQQQMRVAQNEAARLWMRKNNIQPKFNLTPEQIDSFRGTPYEGDGVSMRQTILGRIISGDPSAGNITQEQQRNADYIRSHLEKREWQNK